MYEEVHYTDANTDRGERDMEVGYLPLQQMIIIPQH